MYNANFDENLKIFEKSLLSEKKTLDRFISISDLFSSKILTFFSISDSFLI